MHDLGLKKYSSENAKVIGEKIGKFIQTEEEIEKAQKTYIRLKVEVNVEEWLMLGFWWVNSNAK